MNNKQGKGTEKTGWKQQRHQPWPERAGETGGKVAPRGVVFLAQTCRRPALADDDGASVSSARKAPHLGFWGRGQSGGINGY